MKNKTVENWSQELASKDGKYGGGSAACMVGVMAANLAQFVFELQQGKMKYEDVDDEITAAVDKAAHLGRDLLALAEEDADAFEPVLALYRLPQETDAEKRVRQEKIDVGLKEAAQPPLKLLEYMEELLTLFEELLGLEVKGTITDDILIGLHFIEATIEAAKISSLVNLKGIKAENLREELIKEVEDIYVFNLEKTRNLKKDLG